MKHFSLAILAASSLLLTACVADEPLNSECDVEKVSLHLDDPTSVFYHDYDTLITVPSTTTNLQFTIRSYAEIGEVPVSVSIKEGATIYLVDDSGEETKFVSGTVLDLSDEQTHRFKVVSEDKAWSRNYTLSVVHDQPTGGDMNFTLEKYALDSSGKYYVWDAVDENAYAVFPDSVWKNGNPGFKLSKSSAKPLEYPTSPVAGGGPDGSDCVKLETMDTGAFGRMVNMRIAAGSFFNGNFDVEYALKNARKATLFGSPFRYIPKRLQCWVKWEQGETFQDVDGSTVEGVVDEPDFYVVVYKNTDEDGNQVQLNGDDVLSSPYIVGLGRLPHRYNADGTDQLTNDPIHGLTDQWQQVDLEITYTEEIDEELLSNNGYSMCIDFASSWQGAYFRGAVGSKLYVDNVSLYCEE